MGPFPMNKGYFEKDGKFSTKLYGKRDDFISTLSTFHSCLVIYHLTLLMVCTSRSSLDMQDAAHTVMISDIAIKC